MNAISRIPLPQNESVLEYKPGSSEREQIDAQFQIMSQEIIEIPVIIGGVEYFTGDTIDIVMPHKHSHVIARAHRAGKAEIALAIDAARNAKSAWEALPWENRAAIFLKAAQLLSSSWRMRINVATMMGQGKNVYQAEIDSACELIDFLRFNVYYTDQLYREQPVHSSDGCWNRMEYRPLEGFVCAISPFNFTAIGGNLPCAPAIVGNTVLWKPADTQLYSAYYTMRLLEAAGLPAGVINFIPADGPFFGEQVLNHHALAGIHFTGSSKTFQHIWQTIGKNIAQYRTYPRIVGETGGKDFIVVHNSFTDIDALVANMIRGAFEYQGQKCSAASRAYVPETLWTSLRHKLCLAHKTISVGSPFDYHNFVNAVIDKQAFDKIVDFIECVRTSAEAEIIAGGTYDAREGYFIAPTIIVTKNAQFITMREEIFGPVLTIYVYDDDAYEATLDECNNTSLYALTGAIFAIDRYAIELAHERLRHAAGNFYINDKPTGAVVGQQAFGGARSSGTNDKAGSAMNMLRWMSARTIKETFEPAVSYHYSWLEQ